VNRAAAGPSGLPLFFWWRRRRGLDCGAALWL